MMHILFWLLIIFLTLFALGFIIMPFRKVSVLKLIPILIVILVPIIAISLYFKIGASSQLNQFWLAQKQSLIVQNKLATIKNPQQIIDELRAHLQQHPKSSKGWYLLGRLYYHNQRYQLAENALLKAHQLQPANNDYSMMLAEVSFFTHDKRLTPVIKDSILNVLKQQPKRIDALNLLAINAYQQADYHLAIHYWQQLMLLLPLNSKESQIVSSMLAKAKNQFNHSKGEKNVINR